MEEGWDFNGDHIGTRSAPQFYNWELFVAAMNQHYGFGSAGTHAQDFHTTVQDDFRDTAYGVEYYHAVRSPLPRRHAQSDDCQAESHLRQRRYAATRIDLHRERHFLDVRTTKGDKTVPMTSAARRGKGHDLNAPGVVPVAWRAITGPVLTRSSTGP